MKHIFFIIFSLTVAVFAQVPPKPSQKAVVYDYADMLTAEDKVAIELMGMKLESKYASKLLFVSVENKGKIKGIDFVRAIYSNWNIEDSSFSHYGIVVVCKAQLMGEAGGGFLLKCDNALTMKIKDSFQELIDKTTLPPFADAQNYDPQKGSAALRDSYMYFANAIIALHKEDAAAKPQAVDSAIKTASEAVPQTTRSSSEKPSQAPDTTTASPSTTISTAEQPQKTDNAPQAQIPQTTDQPSIKNRNWLTWIIYSGCFICIIGIFFIVKKSGSHHQTSNKPKKYQFQKYDANDYRDDDYNRNISKH